MRGLQAPHLWRILIAAAFASAAWLMTSRDVIEATEYTFVVEMASDRGGWADLFYDVGKGFNPEHSSHQPVAAGEGLRECRFPFPGENLRRLRFDPLNGPGHFVLRNPRIEDSSGTVVRHIELADLVPVQHIRSSEARDGSLFVATGEGERDPVFKIQYGLALGIRFGRTMFVARGVGRWLALFGGAFSMMLLARRISAEMMVRVGRLVTSRPCATLAVASGFAVVIQCHPILFFGRSFVSPEMGAFMLYDGHPTLPGYTSVDLENGMGSDTAALPYHSLLYPVLVHDALFRDGELPLWNRYSMCGLPALGQGQTGFGEFFQWLPILSNNEAWAWDARFLLVRWLYAFGVGLCVWMLTRHLPSAVITAATAPFIGFFAFRLTHPAQFSLCLSPWILVAWLWIRTAVGSRQLAGAGLALVAANWEVYTSGTVKEAMALLLSLNFAGLCAVAFDRCSWSRRLLRLGAAGFALIVFALAVAPLCVAFFSALSVSTTNYSAPLASQINPLLLLGLFEDLIYRAQWTHELHVLPSANLLALGGVIWLLLRGRETARDRGLMALLVTSIFLFTLVFKVIPAEWLVQVPLLRNVHHIDNSFSCALIVLTTVLAGGGFCLLARRLTRSGWIWECLLFAGILIGLYAMFYRIAFVPFSPFVRSYFPMLASGLILGHLALANWRTERHAAVLTVSLIMCFSVLLWRHSMFITTPFDKYVANPKTRPDFDLPSPAIEFVKRQMTEPSRPNGIRFNLFSGYNTMFRLEGIYGVDPLRNPRFDEFARAAGIRKLFWGMDAGDWTTWNEENTRTLLPVLDALNVRHYLTLPGTPAARMEGLDYLHSSDLDVYESPTVWPRAFFVDQVETYRSIDEWVGRINATSDAGPRAGIQEGDLESIQLPSSVLVQPGGASRIVRGARDYRLTTNSTAFVVEATGPGVAILLENFVPRASRVVVNGESAECFRVNHTFRGVVLPSAGRYEVKFEYRPPGMTLSLWLAFTGASLGACVFVMACVAGRRTSAGH